MATSPLGLAGQMYPLLPLIYRRYDTVLPPTRRADVGVEDRDRGALRRFLDLPGGQLDQLYSLTRAVLDLSTWTVWTGAPAAAGGLDRLETDYCLPLEPSATRSAMRRSSTRRSASSLVEATVARITGGRAGRRSSSTTSPRRTSPSG